MKKIEVNQAPVDAIDWAIAKIKGRAMRAPVHATEEDVEKLSVPFILYEVNYKYIDDALNDAYVSAITVTRSGINHEACATAPSITFKDEKGRSCLGSASNYFLNREEALLEAQLAIFGGSDGFSPTSDWNDGGPIIDEKEIMFTTAPDGPDGRKLIRAYLRKLGTSGPCGIAVTHLVAAMRCVVASEMGPVVEVPRALRG